MTSPFMEKLKKIGYIKTYFSGGENQSMGGKDTLEEGHY